MIYKMYELPAMSQLAIRTQNRKRYHQWIAPGSASALKHGIRYDNGSWIATNFTDDTARLIIGF